MGSDKSHFNVSLIVRDKVTRQCPQTTAKPISMDLYIASLGVLCFRLSSGRKQIDRGIAPLPPPPLTPSPPPLPPPRYLAEMWGGGPLPSPVCVGDQLCPATRRALTTTLELGGLDTERHAHPQPRPFPAVNGRYHKRRPARGLVSRFKAEGPRLHSASALLFHQKGCGLWTKSSCDFVPHN